jgi:hypothetical protein
MVAEVDGAENPWRLFFKRAPPATNVFICI